MNRIISLKKIISASAIAAAAISCKAPMATVKEDAVKKELPPNYSQSADNSKNSGLTPWREFFTDPDLVSLIETGIANNQDLMKAVQEIEIAKSDVLYKNGKLSPTVSAGLGLGLSKEGRYTSSGAGNASTDIKPGTTVPDPLADIAPGLQADWEVDIWHKLRTEKEAAVQHYLSTVEGKNFVLSSLIAEIADDYYQLLALDNQLDVIRQYQELQKKALEVSKIQKQAMAGTELGVKKFEAELAKSRADEYTTLQEITEKENDINLLLGRYPQTVQRSKNNFMNILPKSVSTGIPAELLANRPDVKSAEYELASAKLDVEAARKEFYPTLNISAALGLDAFKPSYLFKIPESVAYNLVGQVAAPLINKSAIKANFKSADAKQLEALYDYDKTILEAYMQVANQMAKIENIGKYYNLKAEQSRALDASLPIEDLLFKNSRADYLEVLMNQRDALDAKKELIDAKSEQLNAVVDIYKALGGGWR